MRQLFEEFAALDASDGIRFRLFVAGFPLAPVRSALQAVGQVRYELARSPISSYGPAPPRTPTVECTAQE